LSELANGREWVSENTQNLALQSVCYLYREVIGEPIQNVNALRSKRPHRVREVLDVSEVAALFAHLRGSELLVAQLIYGCGLRIGEVVELRTKDISFERQQLVVRGGKGKKDRVCQFPTVLHAAVRRQMESMRVLQRADVAESRNGVSLPNGWGRKSPSSRLDFAWWYLFASDNYSKCPRTNEYYRHHRDRSHLSRCIKRASQRAGIEKRITSHNLRHSFATHANEQGMPIKTLQALLGHNDIRTTETYLHVSKEGATAAKSPLESLLRRGPKPALRRIG
jgi:integron integrase